MNIIHGNGLILRRTYYGEADIIYEVFSKEEGRISLFAKGIRKQKSKNRGVMQLFSYIEYEAFTFHTSAEKEAFYRLKNATSLEKYALESFEVQSACSLLSEISLEFLPVHHPLKEVLSLWLDFLSHPFCSPNSVLCFLIKFFSILGIFPEFSHTSDDQIPFTGSEKIFWEADKGLFIDSKGITSYKLLSFPLLKVFAFGKKASFSDFENIRFSVHERAEIWDIFWWFYSHHVRFFPRSKKIFEECFFS